MKPEWKDTTSYSRDEPASERSPREFSIRGKRLTVTIYKYHLGHRKYTDEWYFSCRRLSMNEGKLGVTDVEQAKLKALKIVLDVANAVRDDIGSFLTA